MKQIDMRAAVDSITYISYFDDASDVIAHKLRITNFEYSEIYRISQIFGLKERKERIEGMHAKSWINAIAGYCNQSPKPAEHEKFESTNAVLAAIKAPWRDEPTHAVHIWLG